MSSYTQTRKTEDQILSFCSQISAANSVGIRLNLSTVWPREMRNLFLSLFALWGLAWAMNWVGGFKYVLFSLCWRICACLSVAVLADWCMLDAGWRDDTDGTLELGLIADHWVYEDTAVEVEVVVANDDDSLAGRHGTQPLDTTPREIIMRLTYNIAGEVSVLSSDIL